MDTTKPELSLNQGGVMRCCAASLYNSLVTENEGDTFECEYCKTRLIVKNGVWQWNQPEFPFDEKFPSEEDLS